MKKASQKSFAPWKCSKARRRNSYAVPNEHNAKKTRFDGLMLLSNQGERMVEAGRVEPNAENKSILREQNSPEALSNFRAVVFSVFRITPRVASAISEKQAAVVLR